MSMRAKFPGTCRKCGTNFSVGTLIEWSKGAGSTHVTCPSGATTSTTRPAPATAVSIELAPFEVAEKWEPSKRFIFDARREAVIGEAQNYPKRGPLVRGATGAAQQAPTGLYVVVGTSAGRWESAEQNEDMGDMSGPGWHVTLYLRAANAEERAKHDHEALGDAIPRIFVALAGMVERAKERDARATFEATAAKPGWGKAEVGYIGALGLGACDARRAETALWRSTKERDYSSIVSFVHEGETIVELYHYVYDWDLPRVYAAPLWMLERAQVAQAIVDLGYALQRFARTVEQRKAA